MYFWDPFSLITPHSHINIIDSFTSIQLGLMDMFYQLLTEMSWTKCFQGSHTEMGKQCPNIYKDKRKKVNDITIQSTKQDDVNLIIKKKIPAQYHIAD